jgi:hypothetical protein
MTTGQLQLAVQSALTLQERFPAQAGDAWQLLVLLTQCWPAGMAAPVAAWWTGWSSVSTTVPPSWNTMGTPIGRPCNR